MFEFVERITADDAAPNRDDVRKAARPEKVSSANGETNGRSRESAAYTYKSPDGTFKLRLEFGADTPRNKANILKSLKSTFDAIKSGEVDL
jgi:hypothetical protein